MRLHNPRPLGAPSVLRRDRRETCCESKASHRTGSFPYLLRRREPPPIFCVGENLDEREAGRHFEVVSEQIKNVLYTLSEEEMSKVIVAYEPVWAIGTGKTGKTATAEQAQEIHACIRKVLAEKFGALADEITILYGGSCKPSNAKELFACPDIDGGLIGGAALKADDFIAIAKSF